MSTNPEKQAETVQHVEKLQCEQCRKKWQLCWVEPFEGSLVEHSLECDCGQTLKVVRTSADDMPLMVLQHAYGKTIVACIPAFIAGALFPALSNAVILAAYIVSWIGCGVTFVNEDNRGLSALAGIAIWSIVLVTAAAAVGALVAHAAWWWWQ